MEQARAQMCEVCHSLSKKRKGGGCKYICLQVPTSIPKYIKKYINSSGKLQETNDRGCLFCYLRAGELGNDWTNYHEYST